MHLKLICCHMNLAPPLLGNPAPLTFLVLKVPSLYTRVSQVRTPGHPGFVPSHKPTSAEPTLEISDSTSPRHPPPLLWISGYSPLPRAPTTSSRRLSVGSLGRTTDLPASPLPSTPEPESEPALIRPDHSATCQYPFSDPLSTSTPCRTLRSQSPVCRPLSPRPDNPRRPHARAKAKRSKVPNPTSAWADWQALPASSAVLPSSPPMGLPLRHLQGPPSPGCLWPSHPCIVPHCQL